MMTDRQLLESLKAQIDAQLAPTQPTPVDCVLGPEIVIAETPLEPCQPAGTQRVQVSWRKDVLVQPANGGQPCGPTSGTREVVRACTYVPPPDPTVQPIQDVTDWRQLPAAPRPGYLTGSGYPYHARFVEAQGHRVLNGTGLEVLNAHAGVSHTHVGAPIPLVWKGLVLLDVRVMSLHQEGVIFDAIRKCMVRGATGIRRVIPEPKKVGVPGMYQITIDKHLWELYVPILFDTRTAAVPDGWYLFEMDAGFWYPGNLPNIPNVPRGSTELIRVQADVYLNNNDTWRDSMLNETDMDGARRSRVHTASEWAFNKPIMDETGTVKIGEDNSFGYLRTEIYDARAFISHLPYAMTVIPNSDDQTNPTTTRISVNPNLHVDPPDPGRIIMPEASPVYDPVSRKTRFVVPAPEPPLAFGDKLMVRTSDVRPIGAASVINLTTLGEG